MKAILFVATLAAALAATASTALADHGGRTRSATAVDARVALAAHRRMLVVHARRAALRAALREQENELRVPATITAVGTGTVTLMVNGQTLTLMLPAGVTLPASLVGTQIELKLELPAAANVAPPPPAADDDDAAAAPDNAEQPQPVAHERDDDGDHHGGDGEGGDD